MRGSSLIVFLVVAFLSFACRSEHEEITGVDWDSWKADRNGCLKKREAYADTLAVQTDRLKTLSEMEIVELMGRPDETELLERNQKFFTYYIAGGPGCESTTSPVKLAIRFNAVGLAKEVMIDAEVPGGSKN